MSVFISSTRTLNYSSSHQVHYVVQDCSICSPFSARQSKSEDLQCKRVGSTSFCSNLLEAPGQVCWNIVGRKHLPQGCQRAPFCACGILLTIHSILEKSKHSATWGNNMNGNNSTSTEKKYVRAKSHAENGSQERMQRAESKANRKLQFTNHWNHWSALMASSMGT